MSTAVLSREEELYWLALKLVPGLGTRTSNKLLDRFRSPQAIFRACRTELEGAGVSGAVAQSIASGCTFDDAAAQQQKMLEAGATLVTIGDPRYSQPLREIFDPPILLFARGRVELLQTITLAVVGTRRPTPYGLAVAERLSADLTHAGLTIASGMARGIDTAAHRGALSAGGRHNSRSRLRRGCGLSFGEQETGCRDRREGADAFRVPDGRGRLTAKLPDPQPDSLRAQRGRLVVEGAQYSGSAITAKLANEQGREVFAVPGNITSKLSWAPNLLIKQGAKLIQEWNDVISELPAESRRHLIEQGRRKLLGEQGGAADATSEAGAASLFSSRGPELDPTARRTLEALQVDAPIHLDDLIEKVQDTSTSELIAALFELEMLGLVKQLPGKNFVKVW